jgi:hypothetical protein
MRARSPWVAVVGLVACRATQPTRPGDPTPPFDDDAAYFGLRVNEIASRERQLPDDTGLIADWVELHNASDAAIPLDGMSVSDDWTRPTRQFLPAGLSVPAGGFLVLYGSGDTTRGPRHLPFAFDDEGEAFGLFAPSGPFIDWVEFPALADSEAYARLPDGGPEWSTLGRGTPGAPNRAVHLVVLPLLPAGSGFRYDDGGADLGSLWRAPGYDDSAWTEGVAPLGYGDPVTTEVGFGDDPENKHITTYFRARFDVPGTALSGAAGATCSLRVDDGAVVYLNGEEITRSNMPPGEVQADTLALVAISDAAETAYAPHDCPLAAFLPGANVIAVEVHQASPSSSDLGFDLAIDLEAWVED